MTKSCKVCQELKPNQPREPLLQTEVPPRPWHTIGTDLFYLDEDEYLLIADYYTKYPFVRKITKAQSTSKCIVDMTKQTFSEQGIPQFLRSGNGPHFQGHYHQFVVTQDVTSMIYSIPFLFRSLFKFELPIKLIIEYVTGRGEMLHQDDFHERNSFHFTLACEIKEQCFVV